MQLVDFDGDGDLDVLVTNGDSFDDFLLKPYHGHPVAGKRRPVSVHRSPAGLAGRSPSSRCRRSRWRRRSRRGGLGHDRARAGGRRAHAAVGRVAGTRSARRNSRATPLKSARPATPASTRPTTTATATSIWSSATSRPSDRCRRGWRCGRTGRRDADDSQEVRRSGGQLGTGLYRSSGDQEPEFSTRQQRRRLLIF